MFIRVFDRIEKWLVLMLFCIDCIRIPWTVCCIRMEENMKSAVCQRWITVDMTWSLLRWAFEP